METPAGPLDGSRGVCTGASAGHPLRPPQFWSPALRHSPQPESPAPHSCAGPTLLQGRGSALHDLVRPGLQDRGGCPALAAESEQRLRVPRTGPRPNPGPASERGLPLQIETCFHTLPSSLEAMMDRKPPRPRPPACRQGSGGHRCVRTTMPTEASVGPWAPRASLAYLGPVATGELLPKQTADSSLQGLHAGVPGETGGTEHIATSLQRTAPLAAAQDHPRPHTARQGRRETLRDD